jgi:predicted TIM-barrel fold metal-dependent hydrolase
MVIDFHTHIFPDSLAPKALETLLRNIKNKYKPVTDMTKAGLLADMDASGVDISVVLPVITRPQQYQKLNEFSKSICSERILAFGGLHPDTDDYKRDIDGIAAMGLKGLKFHPEYQNFILDETRMLKIYDYALNRGLILMFHAGYDPAATPPFRSNPRRFAHMMHELRGGNIIAAHFGGHAQWQEVFDYLAGSSIYLDTSMALGFMTDELFLRIFRAHGSRKILFASDSPWGDPKKDLNRLRALSLTEEEKTDIFGANAARLLGIGS